MNKNKDCNLIEVFDALGQSIYSNDWTGQEKNFYKNQNSFNEYEHHAFTILSILVDLIKNHFFDVYNKKTKSFLTRQELDLLSQEISYSSFFQKKIPTTEFEALEAFRTGKYSNKPISTYSLPNNFLIPKEQFDYFYNTCRRWIDKESKGKDELIISEYQIVAQEFENQYKTIGVSQHREVKVDDWSNLISYFELKKYLQERLGLEDFEIDFLIDCEFSGSAWSSLDEPIILEGDIGKSGYMNAYRYDGRNGESRYHNTFYLKSQIDNFKSSIRFIKYDELVKKWNNFEAKRDAVISLISDYIIQNPNCEIANLSVFKLDGRVLSHDEVKKDKSTIASCVIKNILIDKLEKKHFPSFLDKNKKLKEEARDDSVNIELSKGSFVEKLDSQEKDAVSNDSIQTDSKQENVANRPIYINHRICIIAMSFIQKEKVLDITRSTSKEIWSSIIGICEENTAPDHKKQEIDKKRDSCRNKIMTTFDLINLVISTDKNSDYCFGWETKETQKNSKRTKKQNAYVEFKFGTFRNKLPSLKQEVLAAIILSNS